MPDARNSAGDAPSKTTGTNGAGPRGVPSVERGSLSEAEIQAVTVGELTPLVGGIVLVEYDPAWPNLFAREAGRVHAALGDQVLLLEHVGSTSVPGLAAKPRIDMLLVVPNSADEPAYIPALEAAGYVLRIREPD